MKGRNTISLQLFMCYFFVQGQLTFLFSPSWTAVNECSVCSYSWLSIYLDREILMDLTFLWNLKNAKSALWQLCFCSRFEQTLFWIPGPDCFLAMYLFYTLKFMLQDRCSCLFFQHFVINKSQHHTKFMEFTVWFFSFVWPASRKKTKYFLLSFCV